MFVVEYGFATINVSGEIEFTEEMKGRIANLDKTCLLLDESNSTRGGRPKVTYYDVRFPQLGKSTLKSAMSTTMITHGPHGPRSARSDKEERIVVVGDDDVT